MAIFKTNNDDVTSSPKKEEKEDPKYRTTAPDWWDIKPEPPSQSEYKATVRYGGTYIDPAGLFKTTTSPTATIMGSSYIRNSINPNSELYRVGTSILAIVEDGSMYRFLPTQKNWIPIPIIKDLGRAGTRLGTINDFIAMMAEKIKTDNENHK